MSDLRPELARRASHTNRVLDYFRAHEGEWIDTPTLERLGGRQAWRTRVSEAREVFCQELGWRFPVQKRRGDSDPIQNRQFHPPQVVERDANGQPTRLVLSAVISEYRYWPHKALGRDASRATPPGLLFDLSPRA